MKDFRKQLVYAVALMSFCCLTAIAAPGADGNPDGADVSAGQVAGEHQGDDQPGEVQHEDLLDRVFSPLDEAVSDINRSLNKSDDNAVPQADQ